MLIVTILAGLLAGVILNLASDYLPRFAAEPPSLPPVSLRRLFTPGVGWFRLHLAIMATSAVGFALLGYLIPSTPDLLLALLVYLALLLITVIDIKYRLVLNIITYPAVVLVLLAHLLLLRQNIASILVGGVLAFAIFFLTAWLKPGQLGMGDVKLAALIGFVFGFPGVLWALIVGAGCGGLAAAVLIASRRGTLQTTMPYAPFLCLGAMIALLYNPLLMLR
ncbi:MAG: prepilin peptidase [Chloroflexi bacterium]|nr:prepilin peptidase [Chloroflexota bacterium]